MFWDICTSITRLTKQPKLVPEISSKSVSFVPSRGDASKRCQNTFQIERSNWKGFSSFACVPTAGTKGTDLLEISGTTLGVVSQPRDTLTNIPKHAPGSISWLIPKCKKYKLRPPQILYRPTQSIMYVPFQVNTCKKSFYLLFSTNI